METLFVYHKDGKTYVLDVSEAKVRHENLLSNGWRYTATIDPAKWIHCLLNMTDSDALIEIGSMKVTP